MTDVEVCKLCISDDLAGIATSLEIPLRIIIDAADALNQSK